MRILLTAASSGGNPSALATALIALGGALVGGVITAGGQLIVEGRRAAHERQVETARAQREADAREREERTLLRTAARLLLADLKHTRDLYTYAISRGRWWLREFDQSRSTPADLRLLAAHLPDDGWRAVVDARRNIEAVGPVHANADEMDVLDTQVQRNLQAAISFIDAARAAVESLAETAEGAPPDRTATS